MAAFTWTPGSGSASQGGPDRHQRRRGHGDHHRDAGAGRGHRAGAEHRASADQLPPVGPQGAQDGIVRGAGDQLAAEQLGGDHQGGQARPARRTGPARPPAGWMACSTFAC